jgi:hypothetical protein
MTIMVVTQPGEELLPVHFVLCGRVACLQTLDREVLGVLEEEFGSPWEVREEEEDDWGEEDGGDAPCG